MATTAATIYTPDVAAVTATATTSPQLTPLPTPVEATNGKDAAGGGVVGRRRNLTIEQRFRICEHAREFPKLTQQQLAQWARETFAMSYEPSQTSISYALTRGKNFKSLDEAQRKLRKRRRCKLPKLDEVLLGWVLDCEKKEIRISGELVKQKAIAFCDKLNILKEDRPNFSNGWLASFNKRHKLKKFKRGNNFQPSESDDDYAWAKARQTTAGAKNARASKAFKGESKLRGSGASGGDNNSAALPWNELTEDELEVRKRESDLRIEGLRYDNTLKRLRVAEENMLARKRLKDAGISQEEIDKMIPIVSVTGADDASQTVI
ncbi:Ars binding protein 1 [Globisporangium polare]